jgi:hypothetical protein
MPENSTAIISPAALKYTEATSPSPLNEERVGARSENALRVIIS